VTAPRYPHLSGRDLEDALTEAGFEVIGVVARADKVRCLLQETTPDAAVMDLNLAGSSSVPLVEALVALHIPVVIVTGYGRAGLPAHLQHVEVISKPFDSRALVGTLRTVLSNQSPVGVGSAPRSE
jgi:DNA-binding NtrC family response regulator